MILWVFIILVMGLFMLFGTEFVIANNLVFLIGLVITLICIGIGTCSAKEGRQRKTCRKDKGT